MKVIQQDSALTICPPTQQNKEQADLSVWQSQTASPTQKGKTHRI